MQSPHTRMFTKETGFPAAAPASAREVTGIIISRTSTFQPRALIFLLSYRFRWCRTVRCRAQEVTLVLTSVTGTQVTLTWKADLGWYESKPIPVPCGFHSGFILIKDKVSLGKISGNGGLGHLPRCVCVISWGMF